jgi:structural maintenance of chromosome 4
VFHRETNIGRASFIVLEKLQSAAAKMDQCPRIPDGTTRLFDLIQPKESIYRPAFYMGLKDTLVTADWELATRVAYEGDRVKWRIVTTTGNLIDTSGAMTGGGKVARSGGMSAQSTQASSGEGAVTQEQIDRLDATVTRLRGELATCRGDISAAEKELKETDQQIKKAAVEAEKNGVQMTRVLGERQDLTERVSSLRANCELSPEETRNKQQAERQLADVVRRMEESSPERAGLQERVKSLQQQILDVGGPKLKRAQSKVDSANSEYDACRSSLSAAEVSLNTNAKQSSKATNAKGKAEAELSKSQERWTALEQEQKEMEAEAEKVLLAQEEAKTAAKAKEAELKEISEKFHQLEEVVKTVQVVKIDLASNVEKCSKLLKENEARRNGLQKELQKVRTQHADDMTEYRSFVETGPAAATGGEEESKGKSPEEEEEETQRKKSPVVEALVDLSEEQMDKILKVAASAAVANAPRGKGRGRALPTQREEDEDCDVEEGDVALPADAGRRDGIEALKREINLLEADRDRLKGTINMTALVEYKKKDEEFRCKLSELEEVTAERNAARKEYEDLRRKRLEEFMSGFGTITLKLKEMYQMITLGGDAELELVDSLDPFSEGIVFSVRPPKKSWKNISNLSGGEKTLSSLALVFALHHFRPTPLYVMDEIDAALDFKNVSIVANYIKDRTKNAQFVIISLRNNMFELANRLVGIYKTNDSTKSVTINPHAFDSALKASEPPPPAPRAVDETEEQGHRKKSARTSAAPTGKATSRKMAASDEEPGVGTESKSVLGNSTNLRA